MQRLVIISQNKKEDTRPLVSDSTLQYLVGGVAVVACVGVIYYANVRPLSTNISLINALYYQAEYGDKGSGRTGQSVVLNDALGAYEEALGYRSFGTAETREQLVSATQGLFRNDQTIGMKAVQLSVQELNKQIAGSLNDPRYYYFLAGLYSSVGDYADALDPIHKAEALSPKKQSFQFLEAEVLINQKKYQEAETLLKKTYDLAPEYSQAQLYYAIAAAYLGDSVTSNMLFQKYPALLTDAHILQAYVISGQSAKAIPLLQEYIKNNPNTGVEVRVFLAAAYLESGQRAQALSTLKNAKTLTTDQQTVSEVDYYIDLINKGAKSLIR